MKDRINNIRKNMIKVAFNCKGKIHWGSSLSCVEIMYALYGVVTNVAKENLPEKQRDEIVVSKGQAALAVYAAMHEAGMINDDFIREFQGDGNDYPEEIMENSKMRIPCSTGSLGLGLPYAAGVALMKKKQGESGRVYVVVGDGECDEGSIWEAVMLAAHYHLDNLSVIVDYNRLQADGDVGTIMNLGNLGKKFEAFGWSVSQVDGHNCEEVVEALRKKSDMPSAVIANTIKGKGISFMENDFSWHDRVLDKELLVQACREVGLEDVRE